MNALFDRAFDRGLISVDAQWRIMVSARLRDEARAAELPCSLGELAQRQIKLPERFHPDPEALRYHREHIFEG